jgi:phenylalanyl-tRNA synthetase beta chain
MLAPLSWIREFVRLDASVDEIVAALNQLGLEVEGVEEPGREVTGVVVAEVLGVEAHPDADKLTLVDVTTGGDTASPEITRVVCGAPNVVVGMRVPYAPSGATLPGGLTLERRKIRGQVSDGMLCSAKELGLGDDHSGILDLDVSTELGVDVRAALGLDDVVFDLSITPNRPDAMCIVGVARELAAHFGHPLSVPAGAPHTDESAAAPVSVVIEDPERCPRYLGWVAEVTIGPSPAWMQQRLIKAGMRPISNVVDVTNYILLERNQPLHAFDLDRLASTGPGGSGIVVRLAKPGEHLLTLDGVDRELAPDDLLICDATSTPQAIAGIMGGGDSEVTDTTTRILLEAAYFTPMGIARSSKRLKLRSEASARFERGIDPEGVDAHAARAMDLLVEVAAAKVAPEPVDEHPRPFERRRIEVRPSKVNRVLGTKLADDEIVDALVPLGIDVDRGDGALAVTPPSFRPDLVREIDLVEEVARRIGFDAIGRTVARPSDQVGALTIVQRERRLVSDALVGLGCSEAITLSLVAPDDLEAAGAPVDRLVRAANPLRAEESVLRTRILPGLLRAIGTNQSRGLADLALFEQGRVFLAPLGSALLPDEPAHVAAVLSGVVHRRPVEADRPVDVYDAVDAVRTLLDAVEVADVALAAAEHPGFHRTRSATVSVAGADVGVVGEVAPAVVAAFDLTGPVVAFELDLDAVLAAGRRDRSFVAPSPYPPATIDLAFVVPTVVPAAAVVTTLREAAGDLLEDAAVFDEFRSEALGDDLRSLAFSLRFRSPERTLTDDEVGARRTACIAAVEQAHDAQLRG